MDTPGDEFSLPHPESEPDIPEPTPSPPPMEHVEAMCGGCKTNYGFDIKPETASFTFECQVCGTRNSWTRVPAE